VKAVRQSVSEEDDDGLRAAFLGEGAASSGRTPSMEKKFGETRATELVPALRPVSEVVTGPRGVSKVRAWSRSSS